MDNPYSSPQTASAADTPPPPDWSPDRERLAQLGAVMVGWERLRIWYNVALAIVALVAVLALEPRLLVSPRGLEHLITGAIGANVCFLAGPLVEGYLTWWWRPVAWLRMPVFVMGTVASCLITLVVVAMVYDQLMGALD